MKSSFITPTIFTTNDTNEYEDKNRGLEYIKPRKIFRPRGIYKIIKFKMRIVAGVKIRLILFWF